MAVLIRDPSNEDYPSIRDSDRFVAQPAWRYWWFHSHRPPDHVAFIAVKHYASVDWSSKEWDIIPQVDVGVPQHPKLHGLKFNAWDPNDSGGIAQAYWNRNVPEEKRAWALEIRPIHYDRILALDEVGDSYCEPPHLLVDFAGQPLPFDDSVWYLFESAGGMANRRVLGADKGTRVQLFPDPLPDERELYQEDLRRVLGA